MPEPDNTGRTLSPEEGERFLRLFAENQKKVLAYIYSLVPHAQNAEDIRQKTSLVLWRKFYQLEPDGDFMAWACRVAYLEVRNFRRISSRDRLYFSDEGAGLPGPRSDCRFGSDEPTSDRFARMRQTARATDGRYSTAGVIGRA